MKKLIMIIMILLCMNTVLAVDDVPIGNINGKGVYSIYNFTNVTASMFIGDGSLLTGVLTSIDIINYSQYTNISHLQTLNDSAINTTLNIQSLGFNTTTQLDNLFYSINNPNNYTNITYNYTGLSENLSNEILYRIGNDSLKANLAGTNIFTGSQVFVDANFTGTVWITNLNVTNVSSTDWSNIIITESQISDLGTYLTAETGDISSVIAGTYLTGGATSGDATLNLNETALNNTIIAITDARDDINTTVQMREAVNNTGPYNITLTTTSDIILGSNCLRLSTTSNASICFNTTCTWITSPDGLSKAKVANNGTTC